MKLRRLILLHVLFAACAGESVVTDSDDQEAALNELLLRGVEREEIYNAGDEFAVQGDIVFDRRILESQINRGLTPAQRRANSLVSSTNITNVTVNTTAINHSDWPQAADSALSAWNRIAHSRIRFVKSTSSSAKVKIIFAPTTSPTADADGLTPSNGLPGNRIRINPNFRDSSPDYSTKIRTIAHELGHTIGFCHTDHSECGTGNPSSQISGTPASDQNSVMNRFRQNFANAFTAWDRESARVLYGVSGVPVPLSIQYVNGRPKLTWSTTAQDVAAFRLEFWLELYDDQRGGLYWQLENSYTLGPAVFTYTDNTKTYTGVAPCSEEYDIRALSLTGRVLGSGYVPALVGDPDGAGCDP